MPINFLDFGTQNIWLFVLVCLKVYELVTQRRKDKLQAKKEKKAAAVADTKAPTLQNVIDSLTAMKAQAQTQANGTTSTNGVVTTQVPVSFAVQPTVQPSPGPTK